MSYQKYYGESARLVEQSGYNTAGLSSDDIEALAGEIREQQEDDLEGEELEVLDLDQEFRNVSTDIKHIKGKWKRLEAKLNGVDYESRLAMDVSPVTARAVSTWVTFAVDVQSGHGENGDDESGVGDQYEGLRDEDELGDNSWDCLRLGFIATPKEAEIADRTRGAIYGLDEKGRPRNGVIGQKRGESLDDYFERLDQLRQGSTDQDGPLFSTLPRLSIPPHATGNAGNGPLSYKGPLGPDPLPAPDTDEPVRMSPVVDTLGYLPGRSPFQMSRITQNNSDITG
jgi:hypothetical protein